MIAQFSRSQVFAPLLTYFMMIGYWGLTEISLLLEDPYGEDAGDIPLILMHKDFVTSIDELRESTYPSLYRSLFDSKVLPARKVAVPVRLGKPPREKAEKVKGAM